jgi:hypothetical protein
MGGVLNMSDILLKVDDVATSVGVAASTIRKYSVLFEQHGYPFSRNHQGALMYDEDEVDMFKKFVRIKKQKNITLEKAVRQVLADVTGISETASTSDIAMQNMSDMVDVQAMVNAMSDMQNQLKQQEQQFALKMQQVLAEQLELQEKTITANLTAKFNRIEESNKRIEEQLSVQKVPNKSWWEFWK